MLILTTENEIFKFNLSSYELEKYFKEIALNHTIDQTGKKLLVKFRHGERRQDEINRVKIDSKIIRSIKFERKIYYENFMYYSIKERKCQLKKQK